MKQEYRYDVLLDNLDVIISEEFGKRTFHTFKGWVA
jgi:hypothetical protein